MSEAPTSARRLVDSANGVEQSPPRREVGAHPDDPETITPAESL